MIYPRTMYRLDGTQPARTVENEAELAALGAGWAEEPSAVSPAPDPLAPRVIPTGRIYPGWRYHLTGKSLVVKNAGEDQALGEGWTDEYDPISQKPHPSTSMPAQAPNPGYNVQLPDQDDHYSANMLEGSAADAIRRIEAVTLGSRELTRLRFLELQAKNRKDVVDMLTRRLAQVGPLDSTRPVE